MYGIIFYGHISFMVLAVLSSAVGIVIARYYKKKTKSWMKIHKTLGIASSFSFIVGFVFAFIMLGGFSGYHFTNLHSYLGLSTIVLSLCNGTLGLIMTGKKASSSTKKKIRSIHRWVGRIALIMMLLTIFFGLVVAGIIYF